MMLGIIDTLNKWADSFKGFVDANHGNPMMWLAFFLIGVAVFFATYGALHKDR